MRKKKGHQIIQPPIANEERFSNYYCYYLFWVAIGYYLWKKILCITGYRFHPTDFELLHYYLQNKNLGRDSLVQAIAEVEDICRFEPWELPRHSSIHSGDEVWYFFYRPKYKYRNSTRINRKTNKGYWKPTGNPRDIMARDMETVIGKKRTLVFYEGRVSDNPKNKTGWIMHEYELSAPLPGQTTFILCKLKRKYGKGEVSCIEEAQSSQYLPSNLGGNYIENNATQSEAARSLTDQSDPNQILAHLEVINGHAEPQFRSTESWNSYEGSDLPFNCGNHVAENATPNYQLLTKIPIEQELPQDQLGPSEQEFGNNLVPFANERSNQHNLVTENDGSTMPCYTKNDTAHNSLQMDLSNLGGESMDEVFATLEALPDVQRNRFGQIFDDISADVFQGQEIPISSGNQSSTNEEQNLTAASGDFSLSIASMVEQSPPHAINRPRKRLRTDSEAFGWDM